MSALRRRVPWGLTLACAIAATPADGVAAEVVLFCQSHVDRSSLAVGGDHGSPLRTRFDWDEATGRIAAHLEDLGFGRVEGTMQSGLASRWVARADRFLPAGLTIDGAPVTSMWITGHGTRASPSLLLVRVRSSSNAGDKTADAVVCTETLPPSSAGAKRPAAIASESAGERDKPSGRAPLAAPSGGPAAVSPSADAELSYRGSILGALIGALVALAIGWPALLASRRQARAAEDSIAHLREEAASRRSMELMLREGPEAVVARLQRLSEQALRAADRGDMQGFAAHAKALAELRDSLHRSLLAVAAPLNSDMERMSRELHKEQPDLGEVMRLLRATQAALPEKAEELRIHLRQLLAAIATVLETEGEGARRR